MAYKSKKIPGLDFDNATGRYKIIEDGITYIFDFDMMVHLKNYCQLGAVGAKGIILQWYNDMSRFDKKKIVREGNEEDLGF